MPPKSNLMLTYALLVFIWSTTPLAIVWSVEDLHPMWALAIRFFLALPLALGLLWLFKTRLPLDRVSLHSYLAGACSFIGSQIFTYWSTDYLSSGIIALMFGLAPLISGLIGRFVFQMQLSLNQWLGMGIALIGLSVICLGDADQHIQPIGIVIALVGVLVYCVSMFWVKKINAPIDPMAQAAGSIGLSVVFSLGMLPFIWQYAPTAMPHAKSLFGLVYAVIMASLIAMFCYFKLVQKIKPTTLSLTTVLTPMLALLVGVLLNNEKLPLIALVGVVILLFGLVVYFAKEIKASYKARL
ncbi:EamA family transporter [Acinetobacter variabilis]|uniref:DMT family transporter n=1 Tax=Acinetobacter TaxID=469 RepID=UPI00132F5891|nr:MULTISPECIES: EamA family transporter [Acinetobacter]NHB64024.1 EamA family transporter [Acinetobacter sp. GFQ9D191M]NHC00785.1 EamA family transporter [Acinetobacter sp. GFQ9D192M]